jgi:hypothetical protein
MDRERQSFAVVAPFFGMRSLSLYTVLESGGLVETGRLDDRQVMGNPVAPWLAESVEDRMGAAHVAGYSLAAVQTEPVDDLYGQHRAPPSQARACAMQRHGLLVLDAHVRYGDAPRRRRQAGRQ